MLLIKKIHLCNIGPAGEGDGVEGLGHSSQLWFRHRDRLGEDYLKHININTDETNEKQFQSSQP